MKKIYLSSGYICTNNSFIELEHLSINIPKAVTMFTEEACTVTDDNGKIIKYVVNDCDIECTTSIDVDAKGSVSILMESDSECCETHTLHFKFVDETITITIQQQYVDSTDRLIVMLNNYGIQLNDDWLHCFYESDIHEINIDCILKDRKLSEFMLNFLTLVGLRGTYKTLFGAVSYFGYSDIVWFEEHWLKISNETEKRYTLASSSFIENSLSDNGYKKIGDMTMFYSLDMLDPDEPYDETGLPVYVKRNIGFDDLYTKLVLLRSILNSWFIPWDSHIVDIVGELRSFAALQQRCWVNSDMFINQDEESRYTFIDITYDNVVSKSGEYHLNLTEESMLVDNDLYTINADETITLKQTDTAHIKDTLIRIERIGVGELANLKDFDIITKYQRKDVAIVLPVIKRSIPEVPWFVTGFKIRLLKIEGLKQIEIFVSKMMSYADLIKSMKFGITQLGKYEFSINMFDCWGYMKSWPIVFTVGKDDISVDFLLLRPKYISTLTQDAYIPRTIQFDSTHETFNDSGVPVIDAVSTQLRPTQWDINNPDEITQSIVNRFYTTRVTDVKLMVPIRRFGTVSISKQCNIPISEYWAPYNLLMINCLVRGATISLKEFTHQDYVSITFINELQFIHDLIEESKKLDSPFRFFEFDSQLLNATERERLLENENANANSMLMIYSKLKSFSLDKVIFRIETGENEVLTNDDSVLGSLTWFTLPVTWFDRQLTIYAKNENSKTLIVDKESPFGLYYNYIYPSIGSESILRFNAIYNTTKTELGRFVLNDRILTLYDKPLTLYQNTEFKDPNISYSTLSLADKFVLAYNSALAETETRKIVDYHVKFRIGSIWFYSLAEYGKPIMVEQPDGTFEEEFETPPLDFDKLISMFDVNSKHFVNELGLPDDVLSKLTVYYFDSNFVIRASSNLDIELMHMNIGHKLSNSRIGSISKMYINVPGSAYECLSSVICIPNEEIKYQNVDIKWHIYEHFNKQLVFESYGYLLKWITSTYGVFDIEMITTDKMTSTEISCKKIGCVLVE